MTENEITSPGTYTIRLDVDGLAPKYRGAVRGMLKGLARLDGHTATYGDDGTVTVTLPDWPTGTVNDLRMLRRLHGAEITNVDQ